jgi:hypothetical protein
MNWSRGLIRAWVAFTVAWLILVGVLAIQGWPQRKLWELGPVAETPSPNVSPPPTGSVAAPTAKGHGLFDDLIQKNVKTRAEVDADYRQAVWEHLTLSSVSAALVPAFLFVVGWTILWIGRGFSKTQ